MSSQSTFPEEEVEKVLEEVLGSAWIRVDWRKIGRNPADVFQHRLRCASCEPTVRRVVEKLCRGLGLQSIPVEPEKIDFLEKHRGEVLEKLREESVYWTLRAQHWAKKRREARKRGEKK